MNEERIGRRLSVSAFNALLRIPGLKRSLLRASKRILRRRFIKDLARLHDVLESTELAGRYWVFSGMLLGWAREGRLLPNDVDADFGVLPQDVAALMGAVPRLVRAGFRPYQQCRTNDGRLVEFMFRRKRAIYDFSVFFPEADGLHYFVFGWPPDQLYEVEKVLPAQPLVPFEFLERSWLRHEDYERELELNYGDWRTPQAGWNYLRDGPNAIRLERWTNCDTSWID
ncbi:MAG: hypothetical protein HKL86_02350 [Acidimicrobiaceae bacterium]|nr:hypothetical protein [Acidimicrobiaceae bacterium]